MATGSEASRGLKPFAAAPRPEPMHGASSHPNPRNVASLRSRNQVRFSCLISDSSLLLTAERRFAPTTVRYRRISVRYESEQVSAFIGIRTFVTKPQQPFRQHGDLGSLWGLIRGIHVVSEKIRWQSGGYKKLLGCRSLCPFTRDEPSSTLAGTPAPGRDPLGRAALG